METTKKATIKIIGAPDNPFNWTRNHVGESFDCDWFPVWGCWVVPSRFGMHADDYTIRYTSHTSIQEI